MSLKESFSLSLARVRRRLFRNVRIVRLTIIASLLLILISTIFIISSPVIRLTQEIFFGPVSVFSVLLPSGETLKSSEGRTNILLLGTGGKNHEGPDLSDTMIVVSVKSDLQEKAENKSVPQIALISIPRDIHLDSLKGKVNTAYAIGAKRDEKTGLLLSEGAVGQITGLPIHYGVKIDFDAFEKIIDLLSGIEVTVEHTLDDPFYPLPGRETDSCELSDKEILQRLATESAEEAFPCRYERLHFDVGTTHMDGKTALKFVRSRHAEGDEGTDFARARRQQLLISALKSKFFSTEVLLNPAKLEQIYSTLKAHIVSDVQNQELHNFFKLGLQFKNGHFTNIVLSEDLLENPPEDGRGWILLPKGGSWDEVHKYIQKQLKN